MQSTAFEAAQSARDEVPDRSSVDGLPHVAEKQATVCYWQATTSTQSNSHAPNIVVSTHSVTLRFTVSIKVDLVIQRQLPLQ
jgi:hypothetical protein